MNLKSTFLWLTAFSIAMGYLESAVVVYLRAILYPGGFDFPLVPITSDLVITELWREAATIIMLVGAGVMAGKNSVEKFAFFLFSFAVWDIFYYVFLKLLLDWPESLMTWDVLFLIPVTWTGPVLAPVIVSLFMIALSVQLVLLKRRSAAFAPGRIIWTLLISGALVIVISMCWDYTAFMLERYPFQMIWTISGEELFSLGESYIPRQFNWTVFILGLTIISFAMIRMQGRTKNLSN